MTLLGLWGEPEAVHMALLDGGLDEVAVVSFECESGAFPSVGAQASACASPRTRHL